MKYLLTICLALLLSLCSCRASHPVMTETAATESVAALETAKDSVGSGLELTTSKSGYLDISDLTITFLPPDSTATDTITTGNSVNPISVRPYPAVVKIGRLSAGSVTDASLKQTADSVGNHSAAIKNEVTATNSEIRIRNPTSTRWPVIIILGCAVAMIAFTVYRLYRSDKS